MFYAGYSDNNIDVQSVIYFFLRSWIFIMKKLLTAGSLLGVLALAACGSGPEEEGAETEPGETETETETDSESTETEG